MDTIGVSRFESINGVTCYMNSILAILQQMPIFTDYILNNDFSESTITNQLHKIISLSHMNENKKIRPLTFRSVITEKEEMWGYNQHQDSQEFLSFILNSIEDEIKKKVIFIPGKYDDNIEDDVYNNLIKIIAINSWKQFIKNEFSIIKSLFCGMTYVKTTCDICYNECHNFDMFQIIQLSIPKYDTKLKNCFDIMCQEETLDKHNKLKCEFCGLKNEASKIVKIWRTPKILIIQLKRFMVNNYGIISQKLSSSIDYPIYDFDISNYIDDNSPFKNKSIYNLFAINLHHTLGSFNTINFGHYTTIIKNRLNHKWYRYDDGNELEILEEEAEIISKDAYMLFYLRKD
jgi:ubiquitin C-terminal hydrolase